MSHRARPLHHNIAQPPPGFMRYTDTHRHGRHRHDTHSRPHDHSINHNHDRDSTVGRRGTHIRGIEEPRRRRDRATRGDATDATCDMHTRRHPQTRALGRDACCPLDDGFSLAIGYKSRSRGTVPYCTSYATFLLRA